MSGNGEIYTTGKKSYTAAGSDGSDKSHLCWRGGQTPLRLLTVSLIWQNQTNSRTWPCVRYLKEKCHFVLYCPLNCSLPLLIILDIVEGASICQQSFQFGLFLELSSWITTRDANVHKPETRETKKISKLCNSAAVGESLHICKKDSFLGR